MGNVVEKDLRDNSANTPRQDQHEELGDFSATLRVLPISALAIGIGALCACVALALLRLIGLFTNLFYFGRWSTTMVSPVGNHPAPLTPFPLLC
jgi:CIC family chloride channel protein